MESQKQTRSIPLPFEISNFKSVILGCCAPSRLYFTPSLATAESGRPRRVAADGPRSEPLDFGHFPALVLGAVARCGRTAGPPALPPGDLPAPVGDRNRDSSY